LKRDSEDGSHEISILEKPEYSFTIYDHKRGDLNIEYLFDPYHGLTPDNRMLLIGASEELYGGKLMQMAIEACKTNYCNNPIDYNDLHGNVRLQVASALIAQNSDLASQLFIKYVGADNFAKNGMNYEPSWIYALQQLRPRELALAKNEFYYLYATDPSIYQAVEEGLSPLGPD
jgi:hypothetical protein